MFSKAKVENLNYFAIYYFYLHLNTSYVKIIFIFAYYSTIFLLNLLLKKIMVNLDITSATGPGSGQ